MQHCWDELSRRSTGCTCRTQLWRSTDLLPLPSALLGNSWAVCQETSFLLELELSLLLSLYNQRGVGGCGGSAIAQRAPLEAPSHRSLCFPCCLPPSILPSPAAGEC